MNALGVLCLLLFFALPIAWFASEYQHRRWMRLLLGAGALVYCVATACTVTVIGQRFNYNAWYGKASGDLLDASLSAMEAGQTDKVKQAWLRLRDEFRPTYENRGNYDELVEETVARLTEKD